MPDLPPVATNLYELNRPQIRARLRDLGLGTGNADRLWEALYRKQLPTIDEADEDTLPTRVKNLLRDRYDVAPLPIAASQESSDGLTRKYLLALPDGHFIETVIMRFRGRSTVCISSQAGCAMGCVFCATGQQGFSRHLTPGEIVAQIVHANRVLAESGERVRNVVFMGMGEPLHNYDSVIQAANVFCDQNGIDIAPRHVSISTVGLVPGIIRLADEGQPFRLAVSLHGATDTERTALVPITRRWPLKELIEACSYYCARRRRKIFFGWTLIEGKNDSVDQARILAELLKPLHAHLNLIPLNPTHGYDGRPSENPTIKDFQRILIDAGIPSTVRQFRGIDIAAGCGQLRSAT